MYVHFSTALVHLEVLSKSSIKLFSEEKESKLSEVLKKLNAHIRYRWIKVREMAARSSDIPL